MKKILNAALAAFMGVSLVACSSSESAATGSTSEAASGSVLPVSIASEPNSVDPALNSTVDGATMLAHLFQGLAKWTQDDSGNIVVVADAAEELVDPVQNDDGTVTYTYTLREGLKWSDGEEVKASDFTYAWQRAIDPNTAADYSYMFEGVDGYADGELNVVADNDARTIAVTLTVDLAYWNELLAFPTYYPVREDVVSDESWATDASTYVCNGPYYMDSWEHNSEIVLKKNENYIDADEITMDEIDFYLSDDENTMLSNYKNGDWLMIDSVPSDEMATLQEEYPDEYFVTGQLGTYYVVFNINEDLSPEGKTLTAEEQADVRKAITLLFDRNYIVDEIGKAGQVPASSFVAMGMTEPDGSQFYENAGDEAANGYIGYYDVSTDAYSSNCESAVETLKKYYTYDESTGQFTDFPVLTYLYNTSEGHQKIGEYLQTALAIYGITINLENQEWNTFVDTRKAGDYSIARNGWLADCNDPICFLDMWITDSGNNCVQYGRNEIADEKIYSLDLTEYGYDIKVENGTWAETYDVLISTIKTCSDAQTRFALMHVAEDILMDTGCLIPLYYYTDIYMLSSKVKGFFSNPLGTKYFMYCTIEE